MAAVVIDPGLPRPDAARVNGEIIPQKLVDTFLKNDREALGLDPATDAGRKELADLPPRILAELVDRSLIAQGARDQGVAPSAADLDAAEREVMTFCGSQARYDLFLQQNGFTRQEYRDDILRAKLNGKALGAALTKDLTISDAEMHVYYDAHANDSDFQWLDRVTGTHILISTQNEPSPAASPDAPADASPSDNTEAEATHKQALEERRKLAESIREKALAPGADFAALAKRYSDDVGTRDEGGSLGTFARGVHPAALDDAFFQLKTGEIGPVVQTDFGFHVIRANAHLPARRRTFEEEEIEVRRRLLQAKSAEAMRVWLTDARASATILVHQSTDLPPPSSK